MLMMKNKIGFLIVGMVMLTTLLAACQTAPTSDEKPQFSQQSPSGHGRVLITGFHIPKDEPGVMFLNILGALAGAHQIPVPLRASLYDVTDSIHYIGSVMEGYPQGWLEYQAPIGRRTLMLTAASSQLFPTENSLFPHTDFIEINMEQDATRYLVLSQYGFRQLPYFGEVVIENRHWNGCLALDGTNPRARNKVVETYMKAYSINPYARDFSNFCGMLAGPKRIMSPNDTSRTKFAEAKPMIEALRVKNYENWQRENEKRLPYDLMRDYKPIEHTP